MTDNAINLDKKIYRFALFGLSGSGKTCFLTAMGMVCRPTTDGSCCSPLPAHRYASTEVQEGWTTLQEYVSSLGKVGELPKPDEAKWGNYPRYRYAYTDSKIGAAYFEIINYADGVIHHSRFRNEDSAELLKHFIDYNVDGIIVLVSAPKEGQEQSDIPDEIATIQAAVFSFIKGEGTLRHRYPVALVLTKWDRQWERGVPIPLNDADVEAERMTKFMEQHTAYQEVRDLLKGSADGSFKTFTVSALGPCSNDDKPCNVPLESYGIPFVFSWLIQSAKDADFRRFEKMQSELPWWQFRPRFPFVAAQKWE
jgi:hypothetical protein